MVIILLNIQLILSSTYNGVLIYKTDKDSNLNLYSNII